MRQRALLLGREPEGDFGFSYVQGKPYGAVVLGSLTFRELLGPLPEQALEALAQGIPVYLSPEGLPASPRNRGLAAALSGKKRELQSLGVRYLQHRQGWITAGEAQRLKARGSAPESGARLTPLAREILEGSE